jgi:hypothetical protein
VLADLGEVDAAVERMDQEQRLAGGDGRQEVVAAVERGRVLRGRQPLQDGL